PWDSSDDPELEDYLAGYRARRGAYLDLLAQLSRGSVQSGEEALAEPDEFRFPGGRSLSILRGNIVDQKVDAIVSSANHYLSMDIGVQHAIRDKGGPIIYEEARRYVPVRPGRAVVTSGGSLKARFVFHGVTLGFFHGEVLVPSRDLISEILASCFY